MLSKRLRAKADHCFIDNIEQSVADASFGAAHPASGKIPNKQAVCDVTETHIFFRIRLKGTWKKATMKRLLRLKQMVIDDGIDVSVLAFGEIATCKQGMVHIRIGRYPGCVVNHACALPFLGLLYAHAERLFMLLPRRSTAAIEEIPMLENG